MSGKPPIVPNNAGAAAGDVVHRTQIVDSSGAIISTFGGTGGGTVDTELPAAAALSDTIPNPTTPTVGAALLVNDPAGNFRRVRSGGTSDGAAGDYFVGFVPYLGVDGNTSGAVVRQRTPNVFKSFASTAITAGTGATIWTPAAGKKFRLMGWSISSSAAGVLIFGDNAVGTVIARSPAVAAAGITTLGAADMGNGILSAAANNVLKLDGPTGNVAGMVWGTEE